MQDTQALPSHPLQIIIIISYKMNSIQEFAKFLYQINCWRNGIVLSSTNVCHQSQLHMYTNCTVQQDAKLISEHKTLQICHYFSDWAIWLVRLVFFLDWVSPDSFFGPIWGLMSGVTSSRLLFYCHHFTVGQGMTLWKKKAYCDFL